MHRSLCQPCAGLAMRSSYLTLDKTANESDPYTIDLRNFLPSPQSLASSDVSPQTG